jgi:hypothetical protein
MRFLLSTVDADVACGEQQSALDTVRTHKGEL